jgi:hypothetical protein
MSELQGQSDPVRVPLQAGQRPRLRRLLRQRHGSAALLMKTRNPISDFFFFLEFILDDFPVLISTCIGWLLANDSTRRLEGECEHGKSRHVPGSAIRSLK